MLERQGLACAAAGGAKVCTRDHVACAAKAGTYLGEDWPTCPVRSTMDDHPLQLVMQLEAASKCSPITGWPHDFAAWVPGLWAEVRAALNDRQVEKITGG